MLGIRKEKPPIYIAYFETGTLDYWRFIEVAQISGGSYAEIVENPFSGSYAAEITWSASATGIIDLVLDNWSEGVEVIAGQTYTLLAAIKAVDAAGYRVRATIGFFNSSGSVINESSTIWLLTDLYEVKQHVGLAPPGAVNCWIAFRLYGDNGARWPANTAITLFDEIQLWTEPVEITGSNDYLLKQELSISPNPASDVLHILSEEIINMVSIYDFSGHLIRVINNNYSNVNLSNISSGIYYIKIDTEGKTAVKTLIVE